MTELREVISAAQKTAKVLSIIIPSLFRARAVFAIPFTT